MLLGRHATEELAEAFAKKEADEEGFISFDGWDCADLDQPCLGWDGESRRCDCGNCRVTWTTYGDDQDGYYTLAETY